MNEKSLSAVIVNYNSVYLLEDCIENLLKTGLFLKIIVVDNGSTDGSAELLKNKYITNPVLKIVLSENKGLAVGHNKGLEYADTEYILYLGTDAYPTKEALEKLLNYMSSDPDVGVGTARLVLRDGSIDWDAHRGFPTPWAALTHFSKLNRLFSKSRFFNQYFKGNMNLAEPHEIDLCISHFMLVKQIVHTKIGEWDEDYFLFGEDVDFCYRTKQAGFKIMYYGDVEVLHYKGASVGRSSAKDLKTASSTSELVKNIMGKTRQDAMRLFYKKHYSHRYPGWLTGLVFLGIFLLEKFRIIFHKYLKR